jgi:hypothetical protein
MIRRISLTLTCALILGIGVHQIAIAQSNPQSSPSQSSPSMPVGSDEDWMHHVTVLTIAPDGTWGVATDAFINRAIAGAIADCKRKYQREIGCGHRFTTIRAGWSLGFRCGNENIIVAEKTLAEAERQARRREYDLRTMYVPNMPACARTVTIDPNGAIIAATVGYSSAL